MPSHARRHQDRAARRRRPMVRSPRPGRAKSSCGPSTPRSARRQPAPRWTASTVGRQRQGGGAVTAGPHRQGVGGRDPCLACHQGLFQRVHRGRQPADQEGQARRPRLPQFRQLPPTAATTLRRQVADSPNRETTRPLPTLGGEEPVMPKSISLIQDPAFVRPPIYQQMPEGR
jgi:hypothetical protein